MSFGWRPFIAASYPSYRAELSIEQFLAIYDRRARKTCYTEMTLAGVIEFIFPFNPGATSFSTFASYNLDYFAGSEICLNKSRRKGVRRRLLWLMGLADEDDAAVLGVIPATLANQRCDLTWDDSKAWLQAGTPPELYHDVNMEQCIVNACANMMKVRCLGSPSQSWACCPLSPVLWPTRFRRGLQEWSGAGTINTCKTKHRQNSTNSCLNRFLASMFIFVVGLAMADLGSAMPTSGGLYWVSTINGR